MHTITNSIENIKLSKPAQRAIESAGITTLRKLSKYSESDILKLHGIGKTAIPVLKKALKDAGLDFTGKQ